MRKIENMYDADLMHPFIVLEPAGHVMFNFIFLVEKGYGFVEINHTV